MDKRTKLTATANDASFAEYTVASSNNYNTIILILHKVMSPI